jgi:hypothetical protein
MSDELFSEPEDSSEEWVDVRMTDPEAGEWDVDMVVLDGSVEYVDLRIQPELLGDFVECLADDLSDDQVERLVANLADRTEGSVDIPDEATE